MPRPQTPIKDRLIKCSTIDPVTNCWNWKRSTSGLGRKRLNYGKITIRDPKKRNVLAHRLSYEVFIGAIPDNINGKRVCVCHSCDNPLCVNPGHLWLGTYKQNMMDMIKKHRHPTQKPQPCAS